MYREEALENFYLIKEANPALVGIGSSTLAGAGLGHFIRGKTREDLKKRYKLSESEIDSLERQGGYSPALFSGGAGLVGSTAGALLGGAVAGPGTAQELGAILGGSLGFLRATEEQQKLLMRRAKKYSKSKRKKDKELRYRQRPA